MKVKFADSFFESLDRLITRERWYWKTWDWIRYDFPKGVYNIFYFWRVVWNFRPWDSGYQFSFMTRALPRLRDAIANGHEIELSRNKKLDKINIMIEILNRMEEDNYIAYAEKALGREVDTSYGIFGNPNLDEEPTEIRESNREIFDLATKLEQDDWNEFIYLIKGQDIEEYRKLFDNLSEEEKREHDHYYTWFDGSGIQSWWH
jgi:hypothetical protein